MTLVVGPAALGLLGPDYPYLRIIPMHLTIIIGSSVAAVALPLFIGLKTLSDAGMHAVEHALFRRGGTSRDLESAREVERVDEPR